MDEKLSRRKVLKGDQRCSGCVQFVAPNQCKVVEGDISPNGWCVAYSAKS